ncbi:unnamed protein product [Cyprideis torosa]|uniref:Endoplasmic reticulum lectin 1 n=1 Tax=Cyprideis torosa TaxID=163714 RepID=A0A7R8W263_9CRUS|nr:unnamed protein product [Cyprideis torosa]CAG0881650.1 unnamed protein product [Cyprideis torosa]
MGGAPSVCVTAAFVALLFSGMSSGGMPDSPSDSVMYQIKWAGPVEEDVVKLARKDQVVGTPWSTSSTDKDIIENTEDGTSQQEPEYLEVVSSKNERYRCVIPPVVSTDSINLADYKGPSALELLESLFKQKLCSYRLESYWTYEICHGQYVRQVHIDNGRNVRTQEYYLGRVVEGTLMKTSDESQPPAITTKRIEGKNMPYFMVNMTDGTRCDINGMPRRTLIQYVCYKQGKHEVYSLEETSSCEYEVVILSPLLCSHPAYRVKESVLTDIQCFSLGDAPAKPQALTEAMIDASHAQSTILQLSGYQVEIGPMGMRALMEEAIGNGDEGNTHQTTAPKTGGATTETISTFTDISDQKVIQDFLSGKHCLQGGVGWWRYEFCYGKKVDQYHIYPDGRKVVINLGRFDVEKHMDWIKKNPIKKPPPRSTVRKHVTHFYSEGDYCDPAGKKRTVEVWLRCKKKAGRDSVSLYVHEPFTCEYVLGVESPLLCDLLDKADDEFGLIDLDKNFPTRADVTTETSHEEGENFATVRTEKIGDNVIAIHVEVDKVIQDTEKNEAQKEKEDEKDKWNGATEKKDEF